tara:strand:+ start:47737 stop:48567 length:831 start_codon:yes stop_codon:yes gene_type:complete
MEEIIKNLQEKIANNQMKLPTQPEVAVKIREVESDPNIEAVKLATIINKDPGLTARIIKIANSPLMRGKVQIDSLPSAINRLGFRFVCNTATGLAMEQIFQATNETIDKWMYSVWAESAEVAAISYVIAKHYAQVPGDVASLAGLMHKIGILPILTYAQDHDELLDDEEKLDNLIKNFHPILSEAILTAWQFPVEITSIPQNILHHTSGKDECILLSDVVRVSIDLYEQKIGHDVNCEINADSYKRLGIEPNIKISEHENLQKDLDEVLSIYNTKH